MKTVISVIAIALGLTSAAQAANLPNQCYQDATAYAANKVQALSSNITSVSRLGEPAGTQSSETDGLATVLVEVQATYKNGNVQDYSVRIPVQVDDEGGCSVAGQASVRRLN